MYVYKHIIYTHIKQLLSLSLSLHTYIHKNTHILSIDLAHRLPASSPRLLQVLRPVRRYTRSVTICHSMSYIIKQ